MSEPHNRAAEHLIDGAKATPALAWAWAWINGVDWAHVGAFWMALYAVLLVLDKTGLLAPLRKLFSDALKGKTPDPPPSPRTKQDE